MCALCYALYQADQKLKEVELAFGCAVGIPNELLAASSLYTTELKETNEDHAQALQKGKSGKINRPQSAPYRLKPRGINTSSHFIAKDWMKHVAIAHANNRCGLRIRRCVPVISTEQCDAKYVTLKKIK